MSWEHVLGLFNYWVVIFLMMTGFYIVIARGNLIKTIIGLNIFQTSVFLLYITMGKVRGGTAPILRAGDADAHGHDDQHGHPTNHESGHGELHEHSGLGPHSAPPWNEHAAAMGHETGDHVTHAASSETETFVQAVSFGAPAGDETAIAPTSVETPEILFTNPLPSVLMLTAIVVGIATTALALALVVRIREDYGTIEEDEILEMDKQS